MQGQLGHVNDCETACGLDPIRADAELVAWLESRQRQEREKFLAHWAREWERSKGGGGWVRYFSSAR